jgi:hypothetical protein
VIILGYSVSIKKYIDVGDITFNLRPMFQLAFDSEKGLKILDGMETEIATDYIKRAIKYFKENKLELEKLNPKNDWGSYEGALKFLQEILDYCIWTNGIIEII